MSACKFRLVREVKAVTGQVQYSVERLIGDRWGYISGTLTQDHAPCLEIYQKLVSGEVPPVDTKDILEESP